MIAVEWIVVFTVTVIADFVWAEWARAIAKKQPHLAGLWGAGTVLCSAVMAIAVTHDWMLAAPGALGAYLGTFISVRRGA